VQTLVTRGVVWSGLFAVVLLLPAPRGVAQSRPENPYLGAAERLYRNLEFEAALQTIQRAAAWPSSSPAEDVRIALFEGLIRAELGQDELATRAFKRALALDPLARLPASPSPKVRALFEKAAADLGPSLPPIVHPEQQPPPAAPAEENAPPKVERAPADATAPPAMERSEVKTSGTAWWLWAGVGLLVAGAAAVGGVALFHPQPQSPTLGTMNLR
jgi:hypothetical protein